jgi:hypothetical protein
MRNDEALLELNNLIDSVFSKDVYFTNNHKIRTVLKNNCNNITLLNKFKLYKLPNIKIDTQYMYIFKEDNVYKKTKMDMCNTISMHYKKIIKLLFAIRLIYDLENHGENSIAGIISKNINISKHGHYEILFCKTKQTEFGYQELDFSNLKGLKFFVEEILSSSEKRLFIEQFQSILNYPRVNYKLLNKWICSDVLVPQYINEKIHQTTVSCGGKLLIAVPKENPIFSSKTCELISKFTSVENDQVSKEIEKMKKHYSKNLKCILQVLDTILKKDVKSNKVFFTDLSYSKIKQVERKLKIYIIIFFMQSIADYKNIFNIVKVINHKNEL